MIQPDFCSGMTFPVRVVARWKVCHGTSQKQRPSTAPSQDSTDVAEKQTFKTEELHSPGQSSNSAVRRTQRPSKNRLAAPPSAATQPAVT